MSKAPTEDLGIPTRHWAGLTLSPGALLRVLPQEVYNLLSED